MIELFTMEIFMMMISAFFMPSAQCLEETVCPKTSEWTSYQGTCLKLDVASVDWRRASGSCSSFEGRLMNITENHSEFYKILRESNGGDNPDAEGEFWIGAHVPPLVHSSYYDRCIDGFVWKKSICFEFVESQLSWHLAGKHCSQQGGNLARIPSKDLLSFVFEKLQLKLSDDLSSKFWVDGIYRSSKLFDRDGNRIEFTEIGEMNQSTSDKCLLLQNGSGKSREAIEDCSTTSSFICEYSLLSIASQPSAPSYVGSCDEIAVLSLLASEMLISSRDVMTSLEKNRLQEIASVENGFYILLPLSAILSNGEISSESRDELYRLEYCDYKRANAILSDVSRQELADLYLRMYKWIDYENGTDGQSLGNVALYNQLLPDPWSNNFTFQGACILSDLQGKWKAAPCSRKTAFVCQFLPQQAWEIFKKTYPNDLEILKAYLNNQLLRLNQIPNTNSLEVLLDLVDTLEGFCLSATNNPTKWNNYKFIDLYKLLVIAMKIMDDVQVLATSYNSTFQPWLKTKAVDQFLFIEAISKISEIISASYIREMNKSENEILLTSKTSSIYFNSTKYKDKVTFNFISNTSEIKMYFAQTKNIYLYLDEISNFQSQKIDLRAKISVNIDEKKINKTEDEIIAFLYAAYSTFQLSFSNTNLEFDKQNSFDEFQLKRKHMKNTWSYFEEEHFMWKPITPIISATTFTSNLEDITSSVNYELPFSTSSFDSDLVSVSNSQMCSFLTFEGSQRSWSSRGCHLISNTSQSYICQCKHTTDFAVLLLFRKMNFSFSNNRQILFYLGLFGEVLSVTSLLITITVYWMLKRKLPNDRIVIHLNLMTSLMIAHALLLTTQLTWLGSEAGCHPQICDVIAFSLHCALLSSLCWMLVEGVVLYKKIVVVLSRDLDDVKKIYSFIGWILPVFISIATLIIVKSMQFSYSSSRCWLAIENGVIWSFAGPVVLILMFNCFIVVKVLSVVLKTQKRRLASGFNVQDENEKDEIKRNIFTIIRGISVLTPLLGIPWLLGLMGNFSVTATYIFVACSSFQGLHIMIGYLLLNPEIRAAWGENRKKNVLKIDIENPFESSKLRHNPFCLRIFRFRCFSQFTKRKVLGGSDITVDSSNYLQQLKTVFSGISRSRKLLQLITQQNAINLVHPSTPPVMTSPPLCDVIECQADELPQIARHVLTVTSSSNEEVQQSVDDVISSGDVSVKDVALIRNGSASTDVIERVKKHDDVRRAMHAVTHERRRRKDLKRRKWKVESRPMPKRRRRSGTTLSRKWTKPAEVEETKRPESVESRDSGISCS